MTKLIGFHEDNIVKQQTGISRGSVILIPKGTKVKTMHPSRNEYVTKKDMKVKVHHLVPGQNVPLNDRDYKPQIEEYSKQEGSMCLLGRSNDEILPRGINATAPIHNPGVVWAGNSGYWCEADINEVIVIN